jgi:glycosyltransferase involved in cell wall biosynthesis
MRIGDNPSKQGIQAYTPRELGVALLVYIPSMEGYFAESLDILKVQIESLHKNTEVPFDLYVFDNGSCEAVQNELKQLLQNKQITWLHLSSNNLGKTGALNWLLSAMPNPWICYSDSDTFFRDGWFSKSMELFKTFPDVGVVSGQPNFYDNIKGPSLAMKNIQEKGYSVPLKCPPSEIVKQFMHVLGYGDDVLDQYLNKQVPTLQDKQNNDRAYLGACHMQFLGKREQLQQILPLPSNMALSTKEDLEFDTRIDNKGWLRLSTTDFFVVHMGNRLDGSVLHELQSEERAADMKQSDVSITNYKDNFAWRFLVACNRIGFIRKIFKRLYINLFELYSLEKK